ncbi:hypothetical protein D9757_000372 [Collybiopsis confluens]|uniref:Uncharacterized protein n=1 Tax=Collybiopsis confluens TaxID=2823264 RepID=A0A8H5I2G2_9AGAR|nr:hypothetical protein D9757_000372 [Collybiopsis confluens]
MPFKPAKMLFDLVLSMISSYQAWIIAFIALAATAILHQVRTRYCTLSRLDSAVKSVEKALQGYENERASEAIFTWVECRCFRARFNRVYAQTQYLSISDEYPGWVIHYFSPRRMWKHNRRIWSSYRDLCALRQDMKRTAAERIDERSIAVMCLTRRNTVEENVSVLEIDNIGSRVTSSVEAVLGPGASEHGVVAHQVEA